MRFLKENWFKILIVVLVAIILTLVFWNANRESGEDPYQTAIKSFDNTNFYKKLPPESKQSFVDMITDQQGFHYSGDDTEFNKTGNPDFPYIANNKMLFSNGENKIISRDELYLYDGYGWQIFSWSVNEYDSETGNIEGKGSKVIWKRLNE